MFSLTTLTLAVSAVSAVSGLVIPRATPPAGWRADILENYDEYNARYMAVGCKGKQNTPFFDKCCHPMKKGETLEKNRAPECNPSATSTIKPIPTPTPPSNDEDDEEVDCDDEDDHHTSSHPVTPTQSQVVAAPVVSSTKAPLPPTPPAQPAPSPVKPSPSPVKPSPAPADNSGNNDNNNAGTNKGGFATYYLQNGVAGACGKVNPDSAMIAAMDFRRYGNLSAKSPLCGKQVKITNTKNHKSVVVTVADACPTCENGNSIDLSEGAFETIATKEEGMVPIEWVLL